MAGDEVTVPWSRENRINHPTDIHHVGQRVMKWQPVGLALIRTRHVSEGWSLASLSITGSPAPPKRGARCSEIVVRIVAIRHLGIAESTLDRDSIGRCAATERS